MKTIDINENLNILLAGDFNVFFNANLECCRGNPSFEQTSVAKLISHEQAAYVKGRFICETVRLISDIIEVSDVFNIDGFLVTINIEKAFDSSNHSFLLDVLKKKISFGKISLVFINWIEGVLYKSESCVINSDKTT